MIDLNLSHQDYNAPDASTYTGTKEDHLHV